MGIITQRFTIKTISLMNSFLFIWMRKGFERDESNWRILILIISMRNSKGLISLVSPQT